MNSTSPIVVGPDDGKAGTLAAIEVRFMVSGEQSGGGFSLVEHPMPPRALAAPMHRHANEDEYSYVLKGRMGADLGGEIIHGEPGDLIFKPRNQWHTFWNAGDEPASILEIISPAGFENYFERLVDHDGPITPGVVGPIAAEFGLELDLASIPVLCERHGLVFPGV